MEIIGRVSKGSVMDQVYLPKQRNGLPIGSYVIIRAAVQAPQAPKPVLYGVKNLEPLKIEIVKRVSSLIEEKVECTNILITGSFVKQGFGFRDIDILIVSDEKKIDEKGIAARIVQEIGTPVHIILLTEKELAIGAVRDPLYALMVSRCIAKKRFTYHLQKRIINPQLLDVHLLKSKVVIYSFEFMSGDDLYYAVRNMVAISLFLKGKISAELIEKQIKNIFNLSEKEILRKAFKKTSFLKKYKSFYNATFESILKYAHDAKSKQIA